MKILRVVVPVAAFLAVGAAAIPLRFMLQTAGAEASGLTSLDATGTIWNGQLKQASWHGVPVGDIRLGAQPLDLLRGKLRIAFSGGPVASGVMDLSGGALALDKVKGRIDLAALSGAAPAGAAAILSHISLAASAEGCASASGRLLVDGLGRGLGAFEGMLGCEAGNLMLDLTHANGGQKALLRLDLDAQGGPILSALYGDPTLLAGLASLGVRLDPQ